MTLIHGLHFNNLRGDFQGGVTAAVVALPLALAFGVASGAGPLAGLYGAIFVGFFSALIGGTPSQVSGPTGPMTVVATVVLTQYAANPAVAFTIVILGGGLQILFGSMGLGRYVTFMPFTVISGFMTGIGVIIILLQLHPLLGHAAAPDGVLGAIADLPNLAVGQGDNAAMLGLLSLAIMVFTPGRVGRFVPPPLLAIVVCTLAAIHLLPGAPEIGVIPQGFPSPVTPTFEWMLLPGMIKSALILALLGSIDSLLTSLVADNFTRTQHSSDRELIGQGIGNMGAGLFGAIPGAGATMRTVVNIRAGGRTPISGVVHSAVLLGLVLGLAPLATHIPHSALAGILLKVGWDIIDWEYLRRLHRFPRGDMAVIVTVLALTVLVDLVTAVGVGIVVAALNEASHMSRQQLSLFHMVTSDADYTPITPEGREILQWANGRILVLHLSGPFSFCSAKEMVRRLSSLDAEYQVVILDLEGVSMIDASIAMAFGEMISRCEQEGRKVLISCSGDCALSGVIDVLDKLDILTLVPPPHRHPVRLHALRHAKQILLELEQLEKEAEQDDAGIA